MKLVSIALVAALSIPAVAHAGSKHDAKIVCGHDSGGPLAKGEKVTLDADLWCEILWDDLSTESQSATVTMSDTRADGKHTTGPRNATFGGGDGQQPFWQPDSDFRHGDDFASCSGITVSGVVMDGDKQIWSGSTTIGVKCPKPKKLTAKLECSLSDGDANFTWPGNGDKLKPRMEGELDCSIQSKTAPADGAHAVFMIAHEDGSTTPPKSSDFRQYPGDKPLYGFEAAFEEDEYKACSNFTLQATVVDTAGQVLWTDKHKFKQTCPD
jgi:hypothetical protein